MTILITLSSDKKTLSNFEEISKELEKTKSQLFRDMVEFFYLRKDQIEKGLRIIQGESIEQ